jgi:nucleoside phosphorylase
MERIVADKSLRLPENHDGLPLALIITALTVEFKAVVAHLTNCFQDRDTHGTIYECGDFMGDPGWSWKVAVAQTGPGNIKAASVVHFGIDFLNPDVLLLVGVAGGLKDGVKLGDVVAGLKVYGYHCGRAADSFYPRPELAYPPYVLEQCAFAVARNDRWLVRVKKPSFNSEDIPEVHLKPIAAGEQVVADSRSDTYRLIRTHYDDAAAVEMEGYGVMKSAFDWGKPTMVIRGISDTIDDKATADAGGWQGTASKHASAFAFEMLSTLQTSPGSPIGKSGPSQSTTLALNGNKSSIEWVMTLEGDPESLTEEKISRIEDELRRATADSAVKVKRIEKGSIVLTLESSKAALDRIKSLWHKRALKLVAEHPIRLISDRELYGQTETILAEFERASTGLLGWPRTIDGQTWLARKEFNLLDATIRSQGTSSSLLIGLPGTGKSALMSKLGTHYANQGVPVLAIKADQLDETIESFKDLGNHLALSSNPVECILLLSEFRPVLVLLDQLDALADLVDLHSQRLNILLDLIYAVSNKDNVHLVCSCREFEYRHDSRLASIEADVVRLTLLEWDQVSSVLSQKGVDASNWPNRFREMLRIPQHLRVFLQLLKGSGEYELFNSYQSMLERFWGGIVDKEGRRSKLLSEIAGIMADKEILWLPTAKFEKDIDIIDSLEAEGFLTRSDDGKRLGFRHQTLFDFARARAFIMKEDSLARYVLDRQDALFVRPKLWSSIAYLRAVDRDSYFREFQALWGTEGLRVHIRFLLIEFLGQLEDPEEREAQWLLSCLRTPVLRERALLAVVGRKRWFEIFLEGYLPALMIQDVEKAWAVIPMLRAAWDFAENDNLHLIKTYWLIDKTKHNLVWNVMQNLEMWDQGTAEIIYRLIDLSPVNREQIMFLATSIAVSAPDLAVKVIARTLQKELKNAIEAMRTVEMGPTEDERLHSLQDNTKKVFEKLIDGGHSWYQLPEIASAAPKEFLAGIFPLFVDIVHQLTDAPHPFVVAYRTGSGLTTEIDVEVTVREQSFIVAIQTAVTACAQQCPNEFFSFLSKWELTDLMVVQRLLARGLTKLAQFYPRKCLQFLLEDPRRLALGDFRGRLDDSKSLISAVAPYLSDDEVQNLERHVMSWSHYHGDVPDEGPEARFRRLKYDREYRLRLLKAFPIDRLSGTTRRMVAEEMRALGTRDEDVVLSKVVEIGSPMSGEQMLKAKDEHIFQLFEELVDSTEWDNPRHMMQGGSIQASRAFADFAKKAPSRAVSIMSRMEPGKQERPVGYALEALAETDYPSKGVFELIHLFSERGFGSDEFRVSAASAVARKAAQENGLPDSICSLLESWLAKPWGTENKQETEKSPKETVPDTEKEDKTSSILWGYGRLEVIPQGAFTVLEALTKGYLLRSPPAEEQWLNMVKSHLDRKETTRTWRSFCWQLRFLHRCRQENAVEVLRRLIEKHPEALASENGAILIATLMTFLPGEIVDAFFDLVLTSNWTRRYLAYGELLLLRHARAPDEEKTRTTIADLVNATGGDDKWRETCLGMINTAAHLWSYPEDRSLCTEILTRLIPVANSDMSEAVLDVFRLSEPLYADEYTSRLFESLLSFPETLQQSENQFIIDRLQDLLPTETDLVYRVCKCLLDGSSEELGRIKQGFFSYGPELVDISLRLQRCGGQSRLQGLEIFERLLELNIYGVRDTLVEMDGRPINVTRTPRRRLRKRGTK